MVEKSLLCFYYLSFWGMVGPSTVAPTGITTVCFGGGK
jgi:hypothetical protein